MSYRVPLKRRVPLAELQQHLFSLPEHLDWIPYRTSYYKEDWGFCVSQRQREALNEDTYEVCIDSSLEEGRLTYAEHFLQGELDDEVFISCHISHPSLCIDNLSGIGLAVQIAQHLGRQASRRRSYRFLFPSRSDR